MADIDTQKGLPIVGDTAPSNINLGVHAEGLYIGPTLSIKNECVIHTAKLRPEEAERIGVGLIQLAAQARAMTQHQKVVASASNGIYIPKG